MPANTGVLNIEIRVDDKGSIKLRQFGQESRQAGQQGQAAFERMDRSGRGLTDSLGSLRGALAAAGIALFADRAIDAARAVWDAGVMVQRTSRALESVTGSSAGARQEMAWLRESSRALGQDMYVMAEAYKGVAAASRDTELQGQATRDIFLGVATAGTALSLSGQDMQGILYAVNQMISKGTVQAEELRGQMGERLPGAFNLAAKAMGVSTQELNRMLERGEVLATDLLPKLARVLEEEYGEAAARASNDATQAANRFSTAWTDLKDNLFDARAAVGGINAITAAVEELVAGLQGWKNVVQGISAVSQGRLGLLDYARMDREDLAAWLEYSRTIEGVGEQIDTLRQKQAGMLYREEREEVQGLIESLEELRLSLYARAGQDVGDTWLGHAEGQAAAASRAMEILNERTGEAEGPLAKVRDRLADLTLAGADLEQLRLDRWFAEMAAKVGESNAELLRAREAWLAYIAAMRREERYTTPDKLYEYGQYRDRRPPTDAEQDAAAQPVLDEQARALEDFDQTYRAMSQSRLEFDMAQAEAQAQVWLDSGAERIKVEEWLNAELDGLRREDGDRAARAARMQALIVAGVYRDMANDMLDVHRAWGEGNDSAFKAYKAFAIASTIISTYEAAQMAFASMASIPYVGSALGAAAAATAIAGGLARVELIRQQQPAGYALGGVSHGPQLAWVSEGPYPAEAHVPLPDGRSIPVTLDGQAGGVSVHINQQNDFRGADPSVMPYLEQRLERHRQETKREVLDAIRRDPRVKRQVRG